MWLCCNLNENSSGFLTDQQQGFFYMHHATDRIAHTTAFVTPVMEHALVIMRNSSMGPLERFDPVTHCTISRHSTIKLAPRSK